MQYGKQANGIQRYRGNNRGCPRTIFLLQYHDKGRLPAVTQQIIAMTLNGGGMRDIVQVLGVSSATVIAVLKKTRMVNVTREQYGGGYSLIAMSLDMLCKIYTNQTNTSLSPSVLW